MANTIDDFENGSTVENPVDCFDIGFKPLSIIFQAFTRGTDDTAKIIQGAQRCRLASTGTSEKLEFGYGVSGTRNQQGLWITRLDDYRRHKFGADNSNLYRI